MNNLSPKLYSTEQAAKILSVSPSRVRQLINANMISANKIGRDHIISEAEIKKYISNPKKSKGRPRNVNK